MKKFKDPYKAVIVELRKVVDVNNKLKASIVEHKDLINNLQASVSKLNKTRGVTNEV